MNRRSFLQSASAFVGYGELAFLAGVKPVSAAQTQVDPGIVRFDSAIEPLVRLFEDTPRAKLLEEVGARIRKGLGYRESLAALLLAGIRNIQPRPAVGFKFHAVLVVHSAHLVAQASPQADRWLPLLWAVDHFKESQADDVREGDWTMGAVDPKSVPAKAQAVRAFTTAMDNWDEASADAAAAGLARHLTPEESFEIFARYAVRDFRSIGHKAIYVANAWRTLDTIGWQHSEPVLRSLAYAILAREGSDPLRGDDRVDRPSRRNQGLAGRLRADWRAGRIDSGATVEMLAVLREGSDEEAADRAVDLIQRGIAPQVDLGCRDVRGQRSVDAQSWHRPSPHSHDDECDPLFVRALTERRDTSVALASERFVRSVSAGRRQVGCTRRRTHRCRALDARGSGDHRDLQRRQQ